MTKSEGAGGFPSACIARGLVHATIMHARFADRTYVLRHKLWYLNLPLSSLKRLGMVGVKYNRRGAVSLMDKDYGRASEPLEAWIATAFREVQAPMPDGTISLLTLPRVLGLGFNPVSFWLCHDKCGALRAVLAEVNNTFGDRHCYLVRHENGALITPDDRLIGKKIFHVSPFLPVEGDYRFRFKERPESLAIQVDLLRNGRRALSATINGRFADLTRASLRRVLLTNALPAAKVLAFIHFHAARLWLRRHPFYARPQPPNQLVSSVTRTETGKGAISR